MQNRFCVGFASWCITPWSCVSAFLWLAGSCAPKSSHANTVQLKFNQHYWNSSANKHSKAHKLIAKDFENSPAADFHVSAHLRERRQQHNIMLQKKKKKDSNNPKNSTAGIELQSVKLQQKRWKGNKVDRWLKICLFADMVLQFGAKVDQNRQNASNYFS